MCNIEVPFDCVKKETAGIVLGFDKYNEFLANIDIFDDIVAQRKLFYDFFNNQVDISLHFSQKEIDKWSCASLCDVFHMKIIQLLGINFIPLKFNTPSQNSSFKPYIGSLQKLLHRRFSRNIAPILTIRENIKAGKKLAIMVGGYKLYFLLNAQYAFEQFIVEQLSKIHNDEYIVQDSNSIDVIPNDHSKIRIFSHWQMLHPGKRHIDEHIAQAVECIKATSFRQIYIVYPKSRTFTKHIEVKVSELDSCGEYRIKIVPYSLRSILRKRKDRHVNCNFLRK